MSLYLGLDSSTQSLSAIVLKAEPLVDAGGYTREILHEVSLNFDQEFPQYGTQSGVLANDDPSVVHSSPLLWVEALEALLLRLKADGVDLGQIKAIAGSGQQHGSVYLKDGALKALGNLNSSEPLASQIQPLLSRPTAPIWMDSSTHEECSEIAEKMGGEQALANLTGSRAFERFTGPQIRKFYKTEPDTYEATGRIHLVSSFMASVLLGGDASIDPGDGAGMNLMDLSEVDWSEAALEATAPNLRSKLPNIQASSTVLGTISSYFQDRFGFSSDTSIVCWSGDNPCSLIGVGLVEAGHIAISLGTSDTLFGFMPQLRVDSNGEGHVFGSPTGNSDYMSLICFLNGSLAREKVRDELQLDWDGFDQALQSTPPGNEGRVLLPWFAPEITPNVPDAGPKSFGFNDGDKVHKVRAVVEGQMASMALHSRWMDVRMEKIYATGGASANKSILQIMANTFGADVYPSNVGQSAALGAALRAWHAEVSSQGQRVSWPEIVAEITTPNASDCVKPQAELVPLYRRYQELYRACENHFLSGGPDPKGAQEAFLSS